MLIQYQAITWTSTVLSPLDPSHKSNHASDKYPTLHHFVTEMCTSVHISVTKWCIVGYGTGVLWDLCNRTIDIPPLMWHSQPLFLAPNYDQFSQSTTCSILSCNIHSIIYQWWPCAVIWSSVNTAQVTREVKVTSMIKGRLTANNCLELFRWVEATPMSYLFQLIQLTTFPLALNTCSCLNRWYTFHKLKSYIYFWHMMNMILSVYLSLCLLWLSISLLSISPVSQ